MRRLHIDFPSTVLLCILSATFCTLCEAVSCSSNEYCPVGWSVLRREDGSAHTCDPTAFNAKCPRPHNCVHSKCGISFCCVHSDKLEKWKRQEEIEKEIEENNAEEEEEL
ncbi:hypothetical protein WR25_04651 [Diploscapter pachys]|uniref:WAP domain-containing protein n=1 Tax=Diploscapter pachys TaxID=2018661 RepID=A0A2A2KI76_9BILA|nr:hypothetical protein WR25_04651 [Diploscapter pachys]